jgi:hypothetical protein
MFRYDVFREQWLIVVFFAGAALVIYMILFHIDLSLPRKKKPDSDEYQLHYLTWYKGVPWSIWVTAIAIFIFMFFYLLIHLLYPISI